MFDEAHWDEVPQVVDSIIDIARSNKSTLKILDLCCGFGRISAEFARRGFAVTGVDITKSYLQTAQEDASYENLDIEYVHSDAREFIRASYFDVAVNLYISFGYFADQKDDITLVKNVYNSLKDGGYFIIETLGKEIAVRDFIEAEWFEKAGFTVLTEYEPQDSWTFLKNRWILIKDGKRCEKILTQRLYCASELRSLLKEAGFRKVEIYGDWDKSDYDHKAKKLIVAGIR